jgi:hypothetical protein
MITEKRRISFDEENGESRVNFLEEGLTVGTKKSNAIHGRKNTIPNLTYSDVKGWELFTPILLIWNHYFVNLLIWAFILFKNIDETSSFVINRMAPYTTIQTAIVTMNKIM